MEVETRERATRKQAPGWGGGFTTRPSSLGLGQAHAPWPLAWHTCGAEGLCAVAGVPVTAHCTLHGVINQGPDRVLTRSPLLGDISSLPCH